MTVTPGLRLESPEVTDMFTAERAATRAAVQHLRDSGEPTPIGAGLDRLLRTIGVVQASRPRSEAFRMLAEHAQVFPTDALAALVCEFAHPALGPELAQAVWEELLSLVRQASDLLTTTWPGLEAELCAHGFETYEVPRDVDEARSLALEHNAADIDRECFILAAGHDVGYALPGDLGQDRLDRMHRDAVTGETS